MGANNSLQNCTTGSNNTCIGYDTGSAITTESNKNIYGLTNNIYGSSNVIYGSNTNTFQSSSNNFIATNTFTGPTIFTSGFKCGLNQLHIFFILVQ